MVRSSKNYKPAIFNVKQSNNCAVFDSATNKGVLFVFGEGADLCVFEDCNSNNKSYVYKWSYNTPSDYYLNGNESNFKVNEIEVFVL